MKLALPSFTILICCVSFLGCSKDQGSSTDSGTISGRGTINVSGEVNKITVFGGSQQGTSVACLRNPAINYSDVHLSVKGQSKFRVDSSESLSFSFTSGDYPIGHVTFPNGHQVSYVVGNDEYASQGASKDCYADLTSSGSAELSGTITCKGMVGQQGGRVDINANFECSVKTLN